MKHSLDAFVDAPPSVAEGRMPQLSQIFQSVNQLMYHLSDDVFSKILSGAFDIGGEAS